MKIIILKTLLMALVCGYYTVISANDHVHSNHDSHNDAVKLTLNNGKKWVTDPPLRQSMEKISHLMNGKISLIHNNKMSDSDFKDLGAQINKQIKIIFKECKLPPKADQMLHEILIPILKAEKVFSGEKNSASKHDAAVSVMNSLKNYGKYFDHKGWGSNGKK